MLRTEILPLALTAFLALGITAAQAADDDVSTQVSYSDLDLSRPNDAKTLAARLQDAATTVCVKANPENANAAVLENCISVAVRMAMSRIETEMDDTVHDRLYNVRTAMKDF